MYQGVPGQGIGRTREHTDGRARFPNQGADYKYTLGWRGRCEYEQEKHGSGLYPYCGRDIPYRICN